MRVEREDKSYKQWDIAIDNESSNNNFILLSDLSEKISNACLRKYRAGIAQEKVPDFIDVDNFGFYEVITPQTITYLSFKKGFRDYPNQSM